MLIVVLTYGYRQSIQLAVNFLTPVDYRRAVSVAEALAFKKLASQSPAWNPDFGLRWWKSLENTWVVSYD